MTDGEVGCECLERPSDEKHPGKAHHCRLPSKGPTLGQPAATVLLPSFQPSKNEELVVLSHLKV